jgi:hypothetical protein
MLLKQHEFAHDPELVTEAVSWARRAVEATPPDSPRMAAHLHSLARALSSECTYTSDHRFLTEAAEVQRRAVSLSPEDHIDHAARVRQLGDILVLLYERTDDRALLDEANELRRQALGAGGSGRRAADRDERSAT